MPDQDHLIQAIASTLSISLSDILLFDSFSDLGGDEISAEQSFPPLVLVPMAGPFDGQTVALIKIGHSPDTNILSTETTQAQISLLRMECSAQIIIPVCHDLNDKRALQTWVQNMDSETYKEVMKLQIPARRERVVRRRSRLDVKMDELEGFELSPMQNLLFQGLDDGKGAWTKNVVLNVHSAEPLDIDAAIEAIVSRHDMLRVRFRQKDSSWEQCIYPKSANSYHLTHHVDVSDEEIPSLIHDLHSSITIEGPTFAAMHIHNKLYLAAHHLALDDVSWKLVIDDLDELLQKGTLLSEASVSFKYWTRKQSRHMDQRLFKPTLPFEVYCADLEYWNLTQTDNTFGNSRRVSFELSPEEAASLETSAQQVLRTDASDVFLAALLLSFTQIFPERTLPTLWKKENGRDLDDDFNIAETAGWFASLCPIGVEIDSEMDLIHVITLIKDTRRTIPRSGIPFFTAEFATLESAAENLPLEVIFKTTETLQRQNGLLQPVTPLESNASSEIKRIALFEVEAGVDRIDVVYPSTCRHQEKIQSWITCFETHAHSAITQLQNCEAQLTLSDIPLIQTSYASLTRLSPDQRTAIQTILPTTPSQQEILIAQSIHPESFYNHVVYEMTALQLPVDTTRLCEAWETIVANTPALRSVFIDAVSREGLFDQAVLKKVSPTILFIETENSDEAVRTLPALIGDVKHRLAVCYNPGRMVVRLDASQALCDLPSLNLLIAELTRVFSSQNPTDTSTLQNTYLHQILSIDTAYTLEVWKTGLSSAKPCLFPKLSPQSCSTSFDFSISHSQLENFCEENSVEPEAVFQLSWALVLRAFVGKESVGFGYQFNGRDESLLCGIESLVGSFATLLPCFADLPPAQPLRECLSLISEAFTNASKHDNITLSEVSHALGLREKTLFNTCLYYQTPSKLDVGDELTPSLVTAGRKTDCDVSLTLMFVDEMLRGDLTAYLDESQAGSVMSCFQAALSHILSTPDKLISETDLLTEEAYSTLIQNWNTSQPQITACLHEVILQHSFTRPNAAAVCSWDGDITYLQLTTLVQRLKQYLVNIGVGPGMVVPCVLEKNHWAPVMILAVLSAGAAFVPLDAQDPASVKSTIDYLTPHVVLATESAYRDLSTLAINLVIINDTFFTMLTPYVARIGQDATPDHAACIFVTPKKSRSIFFSHASLLSTFIAQSTPFKLTSESRVLQLSAFNVDISLVEILGTLTHGGCVCIPHPHDRAHDIAGAIARMDVTWSYMTSVLARKINPDAVPSLKTLCFRTRRLDEDTYGPWVEDHDVLVAYGAPDICPLGISVTEVTKHGDLSIIPQPITGRFWILNPDNPRKLMPSGTIGELAIDAPLITPHRFALDKPLIAPDPTSPSKPRYLKTGHRVRYLSSGNVQFLSSVRDEVKVCGSNVDVAQVEQVLRRSLGFDCVVDSVTTQDSGPLLAAFLEMGCESLHNLSAETKEKTYLAKKMFETALENMNPRDRLPQYAIPSLFIPIKAFPMSTSLKVNRRKLQRMISDFSTHDILHMSHASNPRVILAQKPLPLTGPEEAMREYWADVLNISISAIKGSSTFFSLGGNKHLAAKLVVACRKDGVSLSLTDLLSEASLTELCRSHKPTKIKTRPAKNLDMSFVKNIISPALHCSSPDVLDFAEASHQQIHALELSMYKTRADILNIALRFNGPVDPTRLENACKNLSKMHAILNIAFVARGHKVYQVHCASTSPPFLNISCPAGALDDATQNVVRENQNLAFDMGVCVTKFTFLNGDTQGSLVIRLSKTQIDEASAHLLIHDLASLYDGDAHEPGSSYLDYIRASKSSYQEGLEYWNVQLDNAKMTKILSSTRPTPPASVSEIRTLKQTVSLGHLAAYGMTPDIALKAAWATVLSTISSTHDVLFGEVIQHTSPIGPSSNTLPVRVQFPSKHSTPLDLMNCIHLQRQSHDAYSNIGIQDLVTKCTPWRSCTTFSTVVQHYEPNSLDGTSTMNIHGATFTYRLIESWTKDFPDLFIRSTPTSTDNITLEIKFSEARVEHSFVQDCLSLLIAAWETVTHPDTIHQPMIQSSEEISRSDCIIPFPSKDVFATSVEMDATQRREVQESIVGIWNKVIVPSPSIPAEKLPSMPFYALTQTLLPAHALTAEMNSVFSTNLSVEDILAHPSMNAQLDLISNTIPLKPILEFLPPPKQSTLRASLRSFKNRNSMLSLKNTWSRSKQSETIPEDMPSPIPTIVIPEIGSSDTPESISHHLVELDAGPVDRRSGPEYLDRRGSAPGSEQLDRRSSGGSSRRTPDSIAFSPTVDKRRVSTWGSMFERRGSSPLSRK
ncbi:uncharacterized protein FIESC28_00729 [Fusarium coffeatum]|uniref:Carrier domain-containing protein n=1 Tax=Fusarium coffeatum TaxID=231269 RepID=A0A366SCQ0_9HYPO|nr:uncharacterized protein FIESC28_00729 [Fusarium coffeatum]RBR26435.1 hypothetical protein FIESC28_00729 [Fusarium coffeatum]